MIFINILDAQTQAVQRVIDRKSLDEQFQAATTDTEKNALKSQIRQTQWELNQANSYIVQNALLALVYSPDIFSIDGLIKTPWSNENQIPNTVSYDINASAGDSIYNIIKNNEDLVTQLGVLITETSTLLKKAQLQLQEARLLPEGNEKRNQAISDSQSAIVAFSSSLETLTKEKASVENTDLSLPSENTQPTDVFSAGIRKTILQSLQNKPGYIEEPGDLDSALAMRRMALDAYYTAKNDLDKKIAEERIARVNEALAPDVPLNRLSLSDQDILLTGTILKIDDLNIEIEPKTVRLDVALLAYQEARDGSDQSLIDQTKLEYDAANADYEITLHEIQKQYDALLGFQKSFGDAGMFPGTVTRTKYTPPPDTTKGTDAAGNSKGYPLIWDTKDSQFVSQKDAKADPGRYLETTYTNRPASAVDSDSQKMQQILSKQYKESAKAEADYTYKKETEQLTYQNENRASLIQDRSKDIQSLEKDLAARKADTKNPMTDEEFMKYQTKLNTLKDENNKDSAVISKNSELINAAAEKRDADSDPTTSWQKIQSDANTTVDGTNRKVVNVAPGLQQASTITKEYYDAKSESQLAQRQLTSATALTDQAKQAAINDAIAKGLTPAEAAKPENWDANLKADYDKNKTLQDTATENLSVKQEREKIQAQDAKSYIDSLPDGPEKQKLLEQQGLRPSDIEKSLNREQYYKDETAKRTDALAKIRQENINSIDEKITENSAKLLDLSRKLENASTDEEKKKIQDQIDAIEKENDNLNSKRDEAQKAYDNVDQDISDQIASEQAADAAASNFSNTGFEGLNNSAPFYMQFPTLNAISEFRLKNGLDPYGEKSTDDIARDAVVFKIFETVPGVANTEEVKLPGGGKYLRNIPAKTNVNTIGSFTIYPSNQDWLSQTHNHNYKAGEQDLVASTLQGALDLVGTGESILKLSNAGINAIQSGSLKGNEPAGNVYNRKIDVLDYYDGSEKQAMEIEFNLFTRSNFLNDIFRPVMFLTALGYPKRALSGDFGKLIDKNLKGIGELASKYPDSTIAQLISQGVNSLKGIGTSVEDIEKTFAQFGGLGPYRYFVSKRPEYMTIRHASGLFYFPVAYVRGFSYTFKGPWYNYEGQPIESSRDLDTLISTKVTELAPSSDATFKEKLNATVTDFARGVRETFKSPPKPVPRPDQKPAGTPGGLLEMSNSDIKFIRSKGLPFAYPSWASCKLSISNATPFFRDDFMALFYESQKGGDELVSLTQTLTNQSQFAFGGRTSANSLAGGPIKQDK